MKLAELRDDHRPLTLTNRFARPFCRHLFHRVMRAAQSKTARDNPAPFAFVKR
jgi:hypothetical protein